MFTRLLNAYKANRLLTRAERYINKSERLVRKSHNITKRIEILQFQARGYIKEAGRLLGEE